MHQWRGFQDGKPKPIDFQSMEAWARLTGRELSPLAISIFGHLERTFFIVENGTVTETEAEDISDKIKKDFRSLMSDKTMKAKNG